MPVYTFPLILYISHGMYIRMKKLFTMRVEESELAVWKEKAGEKPVAEWIRERCGDAVSGVRETEGVPAPSGRKPVSDESTVRYCNHDFGYGAGKCPYGNCSNRNPKEVARCPHGTEKGYRCWQCGGKANV